MFEIVYDGRTLDHEYSIRSPFSPQCYILSFEESGLPVPEKKVFEGFLPYMGVAAILVM